MTTQDEVFSRERLAGYNPDLMAESVALVVGAGALGQNTAQNLALAGIGEIRIVDKDTFEQHNQTRSPAYPMGEEQTRYGMKKARAVAYKLRTMMTAPRAKMRFADAWIQELGDGAFKGVSVVLSCVDTPAGRAHLADKTRLLKLPLIEGGFEGADISLSSYPAVRDQEARTTPCWCCTHQEFVGAFSCDFYAAQAEKAGIIPAIQNAAAVLGGLQAEAAIQALHLKSAAPLHSRVFDFNIRTGNARALRLATDPLCPGVHRAFGDTPIGLTATGSSSVGELIEEISQHFTEPPMVELHYPFVWSSTCQSCDRLVSVRQPDWQWIMDARCSECKGLSANGKLAASINTPTVYSQLTAGCNEELLSTPCQDVGLPPLSIIEAIDEASTVKLFELSGTVDDIFQLGEDYD